MIDTVLEFTSRHVVFNMFEVIFILLVLVVLSIMIYIYKIKINKLSKLIKVNDELEKRVDEKVQELIQKDKLITIQSKQAVMGEMISMIAHQWRQPLSTITLEISELQIKRLLGEETNCDILDEKLSRISDTVVYLSDTIDDFQTYFKPQKNAENIFTNELLNKAVNFLTPRIKKTDIKISISDKNTIKIKTYVNELIQVLMILLNNAVDALLQSSIENRQIELSIKEKDENILIFVKDNANGISDENLLHIFEPYFSTKAKNGTGLGLYMSQMIIQKQFNGKISVETSQNGTIFTLETPKYIK